MADREGTLFLLKYLQENSDEDHKLTTADLKAVLEQHGYATDQRTIHREAQAMQKAGYDVLITRNIGLPTEYHYDGLWEKNELMILIDAVSSAQFITRKKSDLLIGKLSRLAGRHQQPSLTPAVYVSENVKAENDDMLRIIDRVAQGIRTRKKISFQMINYTPKKERILRHGGEVYILSPYDTVWMDDRDYVVGYSEKHKKVATFRIDRMTVPELLEDDAVPQRKNYRVQDYADTITKMYSGTKTKVTLRCRADLIDNIIDKFGRKVRISNITEDTFDVTATVSVSGTFLAWLFQYAGKMIILSPDPVREMYADMLRRSLDTMAGNQIDTDNECAWKL